MTGSFFATTQQLGDALMWFMLGFVCGIVVTIGVTLIGASVVIGKGLNW